MQPFEGAIKGLDKEAREEEEEEDAKQWIRKCLQRIRVSKISHRYDLAFLLLLFMAIFHMQEFSQHVRIIFSFAATHHIGITTCNMNEIAAFPHTKKLREREPEQRVRNITLASKIHSYFPCLKRYWTSPAVANASTCVHWSIKY